MRATKQKVIRERHDSAVRNINICQIESFLGNQLGRKFCDGTNGDCGPVIYSFYKEKPIDPHRRGSPTPDIAVIYIDKGWRLAFIEVKRTVSFVTSDTLAGQEQTSLELIQNRGHMEMFIESLGDRRITLANANQMFDAGINYYTAHVSANGNLKPIYHL